jgi:hypothetical protein
VIEVKATDRFERKSYTVCHELGHLELRRMIDFFHADETCKLAEPAGKEEERLAEIFALNLLMPARIFKKRASSLSPGMESLELLTKMFQTSLEATALRIVELNAWNCVLMWCTPEEMLGGKRAVKIWQARETRGIRQSPCARRDYVWWGSDLVYNVYFTGSPASGRVSSDDGRVWGFVGIRVERKGKPFAFVMLIPSERK